MANLHVETINERHLEAKQALRKIKDLAAQIADTHPGIAQEMLDHIDVAMDKIEAAGLIAWAAISQLGREAEAKATHGVKRQQAGKDTAVKRRSKQSERREQVAAMATTLRRQFPTYGTDRIARMVLVEFKKKRRSFGFTTIKDDIAWGIKTGRIQKP
jgi:hypothetical protein